MKQSSLTVGLVVDHAKALRIPLLIILLATVLTLWVDQIRELFLLLATTSHALHQGAVLVMAGALGFAVWHTARTVYRFDIPSIPSLSDPGTEGLRSWLPRYLGAAVPLLMAVGSLTALLDKSLKNSEEEPRFWMPALFVVEAFALLVFVMLRRRIFGRVSSLAKTPAGDRRVSRWSELPGSVRAVYAVVVLANVLALVLAAEAPTFLPQMGTLALVLMCASFLTVTGTYLTIQAARWQFPLLSALFAVAVVLQLFGWNDNHRIRLYEGMHSFKSPIEGSVDKEPVTPASFVDYVKTWSAARSSEPLYLVSSEGGGIRAAAWTALVLDELEIQTEGEFSKHMLLGSGVSGGSLGLAWFASIVRGERDGAIRLDDIRPMALQFYETDFLGPAVETMFLTDFLQRFVPSAQFLDRGERLESGWERGWSDACRKRPSSSTVATPSPKADVCSLFAKSWKSLGMATDRVPALFLNSTEVQSGRRFIEEPFASMRGAGQDDGVVNAATLSRDWLPASSPLSAVVHNSARFTYVSPAGTLPDISAVKSGGKPVLRQLADGGYFDNSGATTLAELALLTRAYLPGCSGPSGLGSETCPVKIIHISNDPAVETMRSDDSCHGSDDSKTFSAYGEIRAPLVALLNTRDARAAVARAAVRSLFTQGKALASETDPLTDALVFHFRLCKGIHHLPLGWTLSAEAMSEMRRQLVGFAPDTPGGFNHKQLDVIVAQVASSKQVAP